MKRKIFAGTTSLTEPIRVYDTSSVTGAYLSGIIFSTSGLTGRYRRQGDSSWTTINIVSGTAGSYVNGGWAVASNAPPGSYEVHIPNAAIASGARFCEVEYWGVPNMKSVPLFYELDAINYQDGRNAGLSSVPTSLPGSGGGLAIVGSEMSINPSGALNVWNALSASMSTVGSIGKRVVDYLTGDSYARLGAPAGASVSADIQSARNEIAAINQSASRRIVFITSTAFEIPTSGSTAYTVRIRTNDADGAAETPSVITVTATGNVTGNLNARLSATSTPAVGITEFTYTVQSTDVSEQLTLFASATLSDAVWTVETYPAIVDAVAIDFTSTDRINLESIKSKTDNLSFTDVGGTQSVYSSVRQWNPLVSTAFESQISGVNSRLPANPATEQNVSGLYSKLPTMLVNGRMDSHVTYLSDNALNQFASGIPGNVTTLPLAAYQDKRYNTNTINIYTGEQGNVSVSVYDAESNPVNLSGLTLTFIAEKYDKTDKVIVSGLILSGDNFETYTFDIPSGLYTSDSKKYRFALRDQNNMVIHRGDLIVEYAPDID